MVMKLHEFLLEQQKRRDFSDIRLTNDRKLAVNRWAEEQTKNIPTENICMYLVGGRADLLRHIHEKQRMGFTDLSTHVAVEWDAEATCPALKDELKKLSVFRPEYAYVTIICGNIVDVAKRFGRGTIAHLDFDTASEYTAELEKSIVELSQLDIDNIYVVIHQRAYNKYIEQIWPEEKGWDTKWSNGVKKYGPPRQYEVIPKRLEELGIGSRYEMKVKPYKGKSATGHGGSPMLMIVLNKR
jgi:hypothetical protein